MRRRDFSAIPLTAPKESILRRLKFRQGTTRLAKDETADLDALIRRAVALCEPVGRTATAPVSVEGGRVRIEGAGEIESQSLARLLERSTEAALLGATVGGAIAEAASEAAEKGRAADAVVYDAVGSEMAEAAIAYLHEYLRGEMGRTGRTVTKRYSPGYGDLSLEAQRLLHLALGLGELGVTLSDTLMLLPEKSVTAIAGIEERE